MRLNLWHALPCAGDWPDKVTLADKEFTSHKLAAKYGWVRLEVVYQTHPPYPRLDASAYIQSTVTAPAKRNSTLRIGLDNWGIVYLNGQQVAMPNHADEFQTVKIPITLYEGDNRILIKTNNRQNRERHLWAIHCAVELFHLSEFS